MKRRSGRIRNFFLVFSFFLNSITRKHNELRIIEFYFNFHSIFPYTTGQKEFKNENGKKEEKEKPFEHEIFGFFFALSELKMDLKFKFNERREKKIVHRLRLFRHFRNIAFEKRSSIGSCYI